MDFEDIWKWFCRLSLIIFIIIVINSILGDILFRIKFSFPHVSSTTQVPINTYNDPIQNMLDNTKYMKVNGEKYKYAIQPQAEYSLSGLVVAKNNNFWFRDVMRSEFDDVFLIDLGIVWGELASKPKELHKHWKFKSTKTLGQARQLQWRAKPPYNNTYWDLNYVSSHVSHTHIIPANANVMGALLKVKKNDIVKIDGYLVDIYNGKGKTLGKSSLSRTDTDATSRGYGACEEMYAKQVQIGNKIYK